ncbi:MAG TPA: DUF2442 domain-containing protein [Pyrinomonadaceae bacterium]|nr:DUF2442 domain-containing protein [Pyrinomonadaceae bacterium]
MAKWRMSDEEFERQFAEATKRGEEAMRTEPRAVSARYDRRRKRIVVELIDGCTFMFPPELAQGLAGASAEDLSDVRVMGPGFALGWDKLDTHFSVAGLMSGRFGNDAWMAQLAERRSRRATKRKTIPTRAADKKASRPRKTES